MKLPQICLLLGALSGALFFTGCATVTRGTHEALVIETEPSGAQVRLSTGLTGSTPTSFRIPRKGGLVVTVTKEGYETVTVNVSTQVAGAGAAGMAGNVLIGGIIGIGIDAVSGGTLEHKPNPIKVTLVPLKPVPLPVAAAAVAPAAPAPQPAPAPITPPPEAVAAVSAQPPPAESPALKTVTQSTVTPAVGSAPAATGPASSATSAQTPVSEAAPVPVNSHVPDPATTAVPDPTSNPNAEKEKS